MPSTDIFEIASTRSLASLRALKADPGGPFPFPGRVTDGGFTPTPGDAQNQDRAGDHGKGGDKPPEYKPELVCRTHAGDLGARPLAPGLAFWESPDIWVVAPNGTDIPMVGQVNQVHVHVWNLGLAPSYGAQVDVYWCNPSVGVNLAGASLIGSQSLMLNAAEHRVLAFPWTPVFVNGGHECLVAEVFDPIADNLAAPFNPVLDRHVAQRNVNVVTVPAGQPFRIEFFVPNLSKHTINSEIQLHEIQGDALQAFGTVFGRQVLAAAKGATATVSEVKTREAQPVLNLAEHPVAAVFRETLNPKPSDFSRGLLQGARMLLSDEPRLKARLDEPPAVTVQLPFDQGRAFETIRSRLIEVKPNQEASVTLTITPPERGKAGTAFAYRVVEVNDGVVTGGMTYLVRIEK